MWPAAHGVNIAKIASRRALDQVDPIELSHYMKGSNENDERIGSTFLAGDFSLPRRGSAGSE